MILKRRHFIVNNLRYTNSRKTVLLEFTSICINLIINEKTIQPNEFTSPYYPYKLIIAYY